MMALILGRMGEGGKGNPERVEQEKCEGFGVPVGGGSVGWEGGGGQAFVSVVFGLAGYSGILRKRVEMRREVRR